ncbi:MAG: hypothetical protein J5826_04605 [Bacteroidales bacterium]|nr:hypothetical protein [Bacteroidales bacterium]
MKWLLLFVMPLAMATNPKIDKEKCTCNGYPLYGRMQVVETGADLDVRVVESSADIDVVIVKNLPNDCGQWQFVNTLPDVKIRFVKSLQDLDVRFVETMPGF